MTARRPRKLNRSKGDWSRGSSEPLLLRLVSKHRDANEMEKAAVESDRIKRSILCLIKSLLRSKKSQRKIQLPLPRKRKMDRLLVRRTVKTGSRAVSQWRFVAQLRFFSWLRSHSSV